MARWDHNWQGAVQGHRGRRLHRNPRIDGPIQSGRAALSGGKSAPLNRTVCRDPLTSRPAGIGCLATRGRGASTGRLVNAPASDDSASNDRSCDGGSQLRDPEILVAVSLAQAAAGSDTAGWTYTPRSGSPRSLQPPLVRIARRGRTMMSGGRWVGRSPSWPNPLSSGSRQGETGTALVRAGRRRGCR